MTHIRFTHYLGHGQTQNVELIECHEDEWGDQPECADEHWCVCRPEERSADRTIRATRLFAPEAGSTYSHGIRLAVGT
jgi:hypothetical protein